MIVLLIITKKIIISQNVWFVHPFREGNTRTTMIFAAILAKEYGFKMDERLFINNGQYVRDALVLASAKEAPETKYLERIVKDSIVQGQTLSFDNLQEQNTHERLQEIRSCQTSLEQINKFTKTREIYNAYAKTTLEKTGNIWRKTTDVEIYKNMLLQGLSEKKIKDAIGYNSVSLLDKDSVFALKYVNELSKNAGIKLLKTNSINKGKNIN